MNKSALISASLIIASAVASAQNVSVTARIDSVEAMQGSLRMIDVEIVQDAATKGTWGVDLLSAQAHLASQNSGKNTRQPVELASGVELHTSGRPDTLHLGNNRMQINRRLLVQPFDSGDVVIPGLTYIVGSDTFTSNPLALKVYTPDAEVDSMTTVHDMMPAVAAPRHFWDWVPDAIADWWWLYLLGIAATAGAWFGWKIYRRGGLKSLVKHAPAPVPPYERAITQLEVLRNRKLCEKGMEKEFYTELTEILRQYLDGRFGINAMEMTTTQIKAAVRANSTTRDMSAQMNQILEMADFVKFAKMRPMPEDNVRTFSHALSFVENTRPAPDPANDTDGKDNNATAGKEAHIKS